MPLPISGGSGRRFGSNPGTLGTPRRTPAGTPLSILLQPRQPVQSAQLSEFMYPTGGIQSGGGNTGPTMSGGSGGGSGGGGMQSFPQPGPTMSGGNRPRFNRSPSFPVAGAPAPQPRMTPQQIIPRRRIPGGGPSAFHWSDSRASDPVSAFFRLLFGGGF